MKSEEIIRIAEKMQKNAAEETKFLKKRGIDPKKDVHGYEQYQQGWDDALSKLLEQVK